MAAGPILVYAPLNLNSNAISNVANPVNNQDVVTKSWFLANQPEIIWDDVSGKPLVFPPDTHTHVISDITSLESALSGKEVSLGNPTVNGYILSSTTAGVRTWIVPPTSGSGVPNGGTDGQVLTKVSSTDGDVAWETPTGGSGIPNGGTTGQALVKLSNTDGDAGWTTISGGSTSRTTSEITTASLATNATEATTITLSAVSNILKCTSSCAAWVRIYNTQANLTADAARGITEDPLPGSGCYFDGIMDSTLLTVICNPVPTFVNGDTVIANTAYIAVTNLELTSQAITINITYLPQESS